MEKVIESFDAYTSKFNMNHPLIRSRYHHSYRVMELSKKLAESLKYDEDEIYLAAIIGLLHDYGRFEQIRQFNTVSDNESVDHAEYSIRYLFDENEIKYFIKSEDNYDVIRKSIYYHNKYALPNRGLTRTERKYMKLIRDADKLDILYLIGVLKDTVITLTNKEIRDEVSSYFYSGKSVPYASVRTDDEQVVAWLAYIYDLNYKESFKHLKTLHLLEIFFDNLESPDNLKPYFDFIIDYVERKCE